MQALRGAYSRNPLPLNSVVGYTVFASGDAMAQHFIEKSDTWDYRRSLSIGFLGAWQNGVLMHYWYRALDRIVSPATNPASVLKKICCDEAVFAPQLACSYLACSAYISKPGDWANVKENVQDKALEAWSNDLKLWPIANFVGFSFIPVYVRPIYASGIQLLWQTYLSSVGFREKEPDTATVISSSVDKAAATTPVLTTESAR